MSAWKKRDIVRNVNGNDTDENSWKGANLVAKMKNDVKARTTTATFFTKNVQ